MAEIIGTEQERMLSNARLDADRLQQEAERMAVSDVRRLVRDGELLPIEDIPDDLAPAIASIEVVTKRAGGGEIEHVSKVRSWNKNDALKTMFQLRGDGKVNDKNVNVTAELKARTGCSAHGMSSHVRSLASRTCPDRQLLRHTTPSVPLRAKPVPLYCNIRQC